MLNKQLERQYGVFDFWPGELRVVRLKPILLRKVYLSKWLYPYAYLPDSTSSFASRGISERDAKLNRRSLLRYAGPRCDAAQAELGNFRPLTHNSTVPKEAPQTVVIWCV